MLDNLRQHAATVHAEQAQLNETMLASLAPIHAALSQRASREQRRRGEVVEVPKGAVERRRETRKAQAAAAQAAAANGHSQQNSPYAQYHESQWNAPPHPRPRTNGGYDYPYVPEHSLNDDAGPSRRPSSSAGYGYQQGYYDSARPPTAPGTGSSGESMSGLPYPYRPMSASGRELPVPAHYSESEPPATAHGPPPQSPMYGNVPPAQQQPPNWSSPPPGHGAYPPHDAAAYPPPPEGYYHPAHAAHGSYPPREDVYEYHPPGWQGQYPPAATNGGPYAQGYGTGAPPTAPPPHESPFQYNVANPGAEGYPYQNYDSRKRRAEDDFGKDDRKHPRPSSPSNSQVPDSSTAAHANGAHDAPHPHPHPGAAPGNGAMDPPRPHDPNWLPATSERRGSLAISALLGSPPKTMRSRPSTADGGAAGAHGYESYHYDPHGQVSDDQQTGVDKEREKKEEVKQQDDKKTQ